MPLQISASMPSMFSNLRRCPSSAPLRQTLPGEYGVSPKRGGLVAALLVSCQDRRNRTFQRREPAVECSSWPVELPIVPDSLVVSLSLSVILSISRLETRTIVGDKSHESATLLEIFQPKS